MLILQVEEMLICPNCSRYWSLGLANRKKYKTVIFPLPLTYSLSVYIHDILLGYCIMFDSKPQKIRIQLIPI